jgi:hypothetical protein
VFCRATRVAIELENSLEILHLKNHGRVNFLPSWIPNFAVFTNDCFPDLRQIPAYRQDHKWAATCTLRPNYAPRHMHLKDYWISAAHDTLHVRGQCVDTIIDVLPLMGFRKHLIEALNGIYHMAVRGSNKAGVLFAAPSIYCTDALWRTLVANQTVRGYNPCSPSYGVMFSHILQCGLCASGTIPKEGYGHLDVQPFVEAFTGAISYSEDTPHRQFFVTQKGYFGLGTPDCAKGDIVCIWMGFTMPVILQVKNGYHTLLGSAYVHGIMYGEALPEGAPKNLQEFVIR